MEDTAVFLLILVVVVLLFMQFYFVSYRKDAFIIKQIDAGAARVDALTLRVAALEPEVPPAV